VFPNDSRALCVAIHDVAPATWPECLHLLHAMRAVADFPISWLVVPRYHHSPRRSPACETMLESLIGQGHELVLHGYTHLDTAPMGKHGLRRWVRTVYTQREGEFAAMGEADARRRIELGLAWFRERGWPVTGFVAPAWLLGPQAWPVVAEHPFVYTTTYTGFHLLHPVRTQLAPALVYAARNRCGRLLSPPAATLLAALLSRAPLVRLALHPRDAHYPALVRHAQSLVETLLRTRTAVTKTDYARQLAGIDAATSTVPSDRQSPSGGAHSRRSSSDNHSARALPWR
jgi:uncharacterized protein